MLLEGYGIASKCLAGQQVIFSYLLLSRLAQGETMCPTSPNRTGVENISDQIQFSSCASIVEIGVIEKLEMQIFCYKLVDNPRVNCIFKHVDLFLTLTWDLVISTFSRRYYYLSPLLFKNYFYYARGPYF